MLPLAFWSLNDIPGPITRYSPYILLSGDHPIGFGDCPPILPRTECNDAVHFFGEVTADRKWVEKRLTAIHKHEMKRFCVKHPQQAFRPGEKVVSKQTEMGLTRRQPNVAACGGVQ